MQFNNMRTFGVELEIVVPTMVARAHRDLYNAMARAIEAAGIPCRGHDGAYDHRDETVQWKIVSDASVGGSGFRGAEVVSPILSGIEGFEQIKTVTRVLTNFGATVNRTCGLHVHHEGRDLMMKQLANVGEIYRVHQSVINMMVPASRRGNQQVCGGSEIPANMAAAYQMQSNQLGVNPQNAADMMRIAGLSRYFKVNFHALQAHGTIEFRQHQGTLDAQKIISWVVFTQMIVECAKIRKTKSNEDRTRYDRRTQAMASFNLLTRELKMHRSHLRCEVTQEAMKFLKTRVKHFTSQG